MIQQPLYMQPQMFMPQYYQYPYYPQMQPMQTYIADVSTILNDSHNISYHSANNQRAILIEECNCLLTGKYLEEGDEFMIQQVLTDLNVASCLGIN